MIAFHLDQQSGVSPYLQIVQQVKRALRLGLLQPGDQLPTVREVVATLAINPNTVLKAYRELDHDGLIESKVGQGTFVLKGLPGPAPAQLAILRRTFRQWLASAHDAALDDESIRALIEATLHEDQQEALA